MEMRKKKRRAPQNPHHVNHQPPITNQPSTDQSTQNIQITTKSQPM